LNRLLLPALALTAAIACNRPPSEADLDGTRGGRLDVFFNDPGTRPDNVFEADLAGQLVALVDQAQVSIDMAVMGFTYTPLVDALERAWDRGVVIRMVGDAGHLNNSGYARFRDRHFPMMVGNLGHIMHDKFMIVDGRFVFAGTANWSESDLIRNSNNAFLVDSPFVAADFAQEFEQMFGGRFGNNKVEIDNGRLYTVGDTSIEVWFSPNEDAMGRILEIVAETQEELHFTIFAFTKDQIGSEFVRLHERGVNVSGVIDQSQLHSNGQYHEAYRLIAAGIPVRLDGNDNSVLPGDYQAGGGRLHSKTMVIDPNGANPTIITGSFNWSSSATQSNDEYLVVLRGPRVAEDYANYFQYLWGNAREAGIDFLGDGDGELQFGDVVINEVMWYGLNDGDVDGYDEFVELRNLTDRDIRLDMWQLTNEQDVVIGFPPGSLLKANDTFLVLDHTLETYADGAPQDELSAYAHGDLVLNAFNDNRQARMYLKDGNLELYLRDPRGKLVDQAGDGGAAFAGGPDGAVIRSMERNANPGDGADPDSWHSCDQDEGGANVNDAYRNDIIATPGEPNSPG
jgi:phosphatidylserine/phosphatidylglycerophosphate/cardiolipin synthase-like enzyme